MEPQTKDPLRTLHAMSEEWPVSEWGGREKLFEHKELFDGFTVLSRESFVYLHAPHRKIHCPPISLSHFCTNGSWPQKIKIDSVCVRATGDYAKVVYGIYDILWDWSHTISLANLHLQGSLEKCGNEAWRFIYFNPLEHQNLDSNRQKELSPRNSLELHWNSCFT